MNKVLNVNENNRGPESSRTLEAAITKAWNSPSIAMTNFHTRRVISDSVRRFLCAAGPLAHTSPDAIPAVDFKQIRDRMIKGKSLSFAHGQIITVQTLLALIPEVPDLCVLAMGMPKAGKN